MTLHAQLIPSGFDGVAYLAEGKINIRFRFNKRRFAAIAAIKGAKYNKEEKVWQLPLASYSNLRKSRFFQSEEVFYSFDTNDWQTAYASVSEVQREALARIATDPFIVAEDDIKHAQPEIIIRHDNTGRVLFYADRGVDTEKILKHFPASLYLKTAKAYFLPTHEISEFLKFLRDKKFTFAIAAATGEYLKRTAALRNKIIANSDFANANDLARVSLMPFVSQAYGEGGVFKFNFWTAEHLKIFWPKQITFSARKKIAERAGIKDILEALLNAEFLKIKIWFAEEAQASFESEKKNLAKQIANKKIVPDYAPLIKDFAAIWILDNQGKPSLLYNSKNFTLAEDFLSQANIEKRNFLNFDSWLTAEEAKIYKIFKEVEQIQSVSAIATESFSYWLADFEQAQQALIKAQEFKDLSDCTLTIANQALAQKLFPHQRVAVKWLLENKIAFLGDDMGLGKTLSVLCAFEELKAQEEVDFLILIAPASLLRNWSREQQQWTPKMKFCVCPDNKKDREALLGKLSRDLNNIYDGIIINYEAARLEASILKLKDIASGRKVLLCLDESQKIKNAKSLTFKSLSQLAPLCQRRILLSGTPTPKDITDIWSQYFLLDLGARFGKNFFEWLAQIAVLGNKWSEFAVKSFKQEAVKKSIQKAQEILLRRRKEDVVNLPEKIYSARDVLLKGEQQKRYEELRKDLLIKVTRSSGAEFYREIDSILEEYLRAVQIASNPRLVDPFWQGEPAKFVELDEIVHELVAEQGKKLVVWTNFLVNVSELVKRYEKYGCLPFSGEVSQKDREIHVKEFQSDSASSAKILVAVPAAGGVGITLTAAQTAVYIDKTWNAEHWMQSVDRVHRIGQKGTVNIISLHACKIDEIISYSLARKQKNQAKLLGDYKEDNADINDKNMPTREELLAAVKD